MQWYFLWLEEELSLLHRVLVDSGRDKHYLLFMSHSLHQLPVNSGFTKWFVLVSCLSDLIKQFHNA